MNIPAITTEQMREVDRLMIEHFHIDLVQMMENAGLQLANFVRSNFSGSGIRKKDIIVLAGTGGNGGGGLACARRLHNWGANVTVVITRDKSEFKPVPKRQLEILKAIGVPILQAKSIAVLPGADIIIDAIIGYSLQGKPRGMSAKLILLANNHPAAVISLDTPSGLDSTSGRALEPTIRADSTITLALPKTGLLTSSAKEFVGKLFLADISVPNELYEMLGISVEPVFEISNIIQVS